VSHRCADMRPARKPLDPAANSRVESAAKSRPSKVSLQKAAELQLTKGRYFLQSPYLFICATLVEEEKEEVVKTNDNRCALVGSVVSSLHRIKDSNNHGTFLLLSEIAFNGRRRWFFRVGRHILQSSREISIKILTLDFRVRGDNRSAVYLQSICSEPFEGEKSLGLVHQWLTRHSGCGKRLQWHEGVDTALTNVPSSGHPPQAAKGAQG